MPLAKILGDFKSNIDQCDNLIATAHKIDSSGTPIFLPIDQKQITVSAFLNMFIAWESFLELSLSNLMVGCCTLNGSLPVKYVAPVDVIAAQKLVIGILRYFDYGDHDKVRKIVEIYFKDGHPYEPHLGGISYLLKDLRTMRNSSAHITSTTQAALEALAQRLFVRPCPNIDLYQLLMMIDPKSSAGDTVYLTYKKALIVTAELIVQG